MRRLALPVLLSLACADDEILHDLDETQANQVLVVLGEEGVAGHAARSGGSGTGFDVAVPAADAGRARRALAERELPRPRPQGFAEVFGKGSMVPTPTEERALYHHALGGELSRSIESIDGVVEARVHLALPASDPFRPEAQRPPRAAVLVKCRPEARSRVEGLARGIAALVAGAAEGLDAASVAVVVTEAVPAASPPARRRRGPSLLLLSLATAAGGAGTALAAASLRGRLGRGRAP